MLLFKRIKYKKDLVSYKKIVAALSDLLVQMIKDFSSVKDFMDYNESESLLLTSEMVDVVKLTNLYSRNRLSKPATVLCLNQFSQSATYYENMVKAKIAYLQLCDTQRSTEETMCSMEDEVELGKLRQSHNRVNNMIGVQIFEAQRNHTKLLRTFSAMLSALRDEFFTVVMEEDVIESFYDMNKTSDEIKLTITKLQNINDKGV